MAHRPTTPDGSHNPSGVTHLMGDFEVDQINPQSTIVAVTAIDGVAAAGATPTKAEYDVVVALANETKAQFNLLLAALKTAGIIKSS